jgi:hypothetical protein
LRNAQKSFNRQKEAIIEESVTVINLKLKNDRKFDTKTYGTVRTVKQEQMFEDYIID